MNSEISIEYIVKDKMQDKLVQEDTARRASTKTGITEKEIPIQ